MGKIQDTIHQLLGELKEICEENRIPYYLTGWTALFAGCLGTFPDELFVGQIMIPIRDRNRLAEAIRKKNLPARELDYPGDNPDFPGLFLKYTAADTTAFEIYHEKGFRHHGISVHIELLRYEIPDAEEEKRYNLLEQGLLSRHNAEGAEGSAEEKGRKAVAAWRKEKDMESLFRELAAAYEKPSDRILCRTKLKPRFTLSMDAADFARTEEVEVDGVPYPIPGDRETFLTALYGKNYRGTLEKGLRYPKMLVDADVPYRTFFAGIGKEPVGFLKENERFNESMEPIWQGFIPHRDYIWKVWAKVKAVSGQIRLQDEYGEAKLEAVRTAYDGGDYEELYLLLADWQEYNRFLAANHLKWENYPVHPALTALAEESGVGFLPPRR